MGSSDKIALLGVVVTVALFVLGVGWQHYHSVLRKDDARAVVVARLRRGHWNAVYHDLLGRLLAWLDRTIDPPMFVRGNGGRRQAGIKSLGVCITLSLFYSIAALLVGWVRGGPSTLGDVTLFGDLGWAPAWLPDGGARLLVALLVCLLAGSFYWYAPAAGRWGERSAHRVAARFGWHAPHLLRVTAEAVFFFLAVALAYAVAGAFALVVAAAGAVTVAGFSEMALHFSLFLGLLPMANGALDWISLTVSRWFGGCILAKSESSRALGRTLLLAFLDLVAAMGFLFAIAWLLAGGVEALGVLLGLPLDLETYVREAIAYPWSSGLWASIMVLSTLLPTAVHFMLALGAVLFAWDRNPLNRVVADRLATGNEAYFLWPQLYLTIGWPLMALATFTALYYGLGGLFMVVIVPLPDALLGTALHAIETARMWFG